MEPLRILIADDHESVRTLLRYIIESSTEWKICGEARNGEEAIESAKALQPDVIVMDVMMPGCDGLQATREIRRTSPHSCIVITTLYNFPALSGEVLRAGGSGYFLKSDSVRDLVPSVRTLLAQRSSEDRPLVQ